jgi:hypothetical protein
MMLPHSGQLPELAVQTAMVGTNVSDDVPETESPPDDVEQATGTIAREARRKGKMRSMRRIIACRGSLVGCRCSRPILANAARWGSTPPIATGKVTEVEATREVNAWRE